MFDSGKKEEYIEKSSNKIMKSLESMEVTWTEKQDAALKKQMKENMKKKEHANAYKDAFWKVASSTVVPLPP